MDIIECGRMKFLSVETMQMARERGEEGNQE